MITPGILNSSVKSVPYEIGNLAFWFCGKDPLGNNVAPADGTSIATWVDKSANGINVSQATGSKQAVFKTSIINGRPALLFTPASLQFYQRAAVRVFDNINSYSIFAVIRPNSIAANSAVLEGGNGVGTGIYALGLSSGRIRLVNRSPYAGSGGDDTISANNAITVSNNFFLQFERNGTTGNQTVTSSNGVTANVTPLTQPALPATDMLFTIGANGGGPTGTYFNGYMAEVLGFTKILSAAEKAVLKNYILQEWGVTP